MIVERRTQERGASWNPGGFALAQRRPSPAEQSIGLSVAAARRLSDLLPGAQPRGWSYEVVDDPTLAETGGVMVVNGEARALVNRARVNEQAAAFGLDATRLGLAVAEQEVVQKYIQSDPRYAGLSRQDEEVIGEAAMLTAYSQSALRTLERSAQTRRAGSRGHPYSAIADLTEAALERTLNNVPRRPGSAGLSGADALRAYDAFVTQESGRFGNYRELFHAFSRDVLAVENPQQFLNAFEGTMVADFQAAARALVTGR